VLHSSARARLAPQEVRTFFVTSRTAASAPIFRKPELCQLFVNVLSENREKHRLELHEFVIMRDHVHLLITPAAELSLEKCVQYLKGGFSFRVKKELSFALDVWQRSFNEHRVKGPGEYQHHRDYIYDNPVGAGYVQQPREYCFSSASGLYVLDPAPEHLRG
jgi:putative transposase